MVMLVSPTKGNLLVAVVFGKQLLFTRMQRSSGMRRRWCSGPKAGRYCPDNTLILGFQGEMWSQQGDLAAPGGITASWVNLSIESCHIG